MLNKVVWLLWMQGWSSAPFIVDKVRQSWEFHNPGYQFVLLDSDSVRTHLPQAEYMWDDRIQVAARSDIVRVSLLAKYGGVWADASMLCMQPLDTWLPASLSVSPVFMYHSGQTSMPCSWFIASTNSSYVMRAWRDATDEYWKRYDWNLTHAYPYFWLDMLFKEQYEKDARFKEEWDATPFDDCTVYGGPAYLHTRHHTLIDDALYAQLRDRPPHVIKLSVHGSPLRMTAAEEALLPNTTSHAAVRLSLRAPAGVAVVVSHHTEDDGCLGRTLEIISRKIRDYDLFFFTKGPTPAEDIKLNHTRVKRRSNMKNVGREGETYVSFIIDNYNTLLLQYSHVLFSQACVHDGFERKLSSFADASTRVLNLGGYEPGTCDGTDAYPMRHLEELYAMVRFQWCPYKGDARFSSYMNGMFVVSTGTLRNVTQTVWQQIHIALVTDIFNDDIQFIKEEKNKEKIKQMQDFHLNANYFSFELERAWSFLFQCEHSEHCVTR